MRLLLSFVLLLNTLPVTAQVYRCGNSYQSTPCTGAHQVDVSTAVSAGASAHTAVYLCRRYDGQRFWASMPCHQYRNSLLEREVHVPADLSWKEQLVHAKKTRDEAEALQIPPRTFSTDPSFRKAPSCERFQQALERNASNARAGGSGRYMDRLNEERRHLSVEKWRAGC